MDFKSFIIGFLICLCMVLLTGFGGSSSGRYQFHPIKLLVLDTTTGTVKPIAGSYGREFKEYKHF